MTIQTEPIAGNPAVSRSSKPMLVAATAATWLFAALMTVSGILYLLRLAPVVDAVTSLGYPLYFVTLLGVAKLLGVVALVAPPARPLREWAYAGFTFDLVAAVVSHVATGGAGKAVPPLVVLGLLMASYFLGRRAAAGASGR
jgi:hypothetical protein